MKNSKGILLAKGETQSLKGDSVLQSTPQWEIVLCKALCLDQQCVGCSKEQKTRANDTLLMQFLISKA